MGQREPVKAQDASSPGRAEPSQGCRPHPWCRPLLQVENVGRNDAFETVEWCERWEQNL